MRLHESAVGNYAATLLGGATATEIEAGKDPEFDAELPDWLEEAWQQRTERAGGATAEDEAPFKQWSMTFRERPISVDFDDHLVKLTTHIAQLKSGDQTFANWDITGTYTAELDGDGGVVLRREGDLVVLPADFRGSLTSRQTAERRNLEKEINSTVRTRPRLPHDDRVRGSNPKVPSPTPDRSKSTRSQATTTGSSWPGIEGRRVSRCVRGLAIAKRGKARTLYPVLSTRYSAR